MIRAAIIVAVATTFFSAGARADTCQSLREKCMKDPKAQKAECEKSFHMSQSDGMWVQREASGKTVQFACERLSRPMGR